MRGLSIACRLFLGLVAFSIVGSAFSKLSGLSPGWIAPIAAMLTLLMGVWAILGPIVSGDGPRAAIGAACVLLVGSLAEIAGIYTGLPFGRYAYTDRWWPVVDLPGGHRFPVLVPFAWFLIAGGSYLLACRQWPKTALIVGPLLAAAIDLGMEPIMTNHLGYWRWLHVGPLPGGASILNPIGWILTSFLAAWILSRTAGPCTRSGREPSVVLLAYVVLMIFLSIFTRASQ